MTAGALASDALRFRKGRASQDREAEAQERHQITPGSFGDGHLPCGVVRRSQSKTQRPGVGPRLRRAEAVQRP
jgi:hypothetical protein